MNHIKYFALVAAMCAATSVSAQVVENDPNVSTDYWLDTNQADGKDQKILRDYKFWDNWFAGIQGGVLYNWGSNQDHTSFWRHLRPTAAAYVGKWLSPSVGMRLQLGWASNRGLAEFTNEYKPYHFHTGTLFGDGMFNLTNIFGGYRESRFFNLIGFFGIGGEQTFGFSERAWNSGESKYNEEKCTLLGLRAGIMMLFRLGERWDFSVEASNTWIDDSFDGILTHNKWDGHANLLLGLNYRFKNPTDGAHQFTYYLRDYSQYNDLNAELNRLRKEAEDVRKNRPTVDVKSQQINVLVSFANGSSDIDEMQEVNVFTAAQEMKDHNNQLNLYITVLGNAGTLFNDRANTIRETLINEYQIPSNRIFIEKDAKKVESQQTDKNCIIVYINENGKL